MTNMRIPATIGQVVKAFLVGEYQGITSVAQAGEIFLRLKGRNPAAEFFLRGFLGNDPVEGNYLSLSVANARDEADRAEQINKLRETSYAFLWACWKNLNFETQLLLRHMESEPPYPEFFANVKRMVRDGKMLERVAEMA